jgi:hypothetical protein
MARSSSSPKKAARRSLEKYSSKFCSGVIDGVVQAQLEEVDKNVTTTEKWLTKMKASLLRKISNCSKVAFLPEEQRPEVLKELIEEEQETINLLTSKIMDSAAKRMKSSNLTKVEVLPGKDLPESGRFDPHVKTISRLLTKVSHDLDQLGKVADTRIDKLTNQVKEVEGNWKKNKDTGKRSPGKDSKSRSPSKGSRQVGALGKLHDHLQKP